MQNDSSSSFRREAHASAFKNPPTDVLKNISPDATLSFDFQDLHSSPSSLSGLRVTNPTPLTITTGIPSRELKSLGDDHSEQDPKINSGEIFSHDTHSDMAIPNSVSHHFHPNLHDNLHVSNMVESFICYDDDDDNNNNDDDDADKDVDVDKSSIERTNHSEGTGSDPPDNESTFDCNESLYLSNLWGKDQESIGNHEQKVERKVGEAHDSSYDMLGKENTDNKHMDQVCQGMIENSCPVESNEKVGGNRPVASKSVSVFSSSDVQHDPFRGAVESQKWFFENPGSTTNFSNATQQEFESNLQSKFDTLAVPAQVQEYPKNGESSNLPRMAVKKYKWKPTVLHNETLFKQTTDLQALLPGRDMPRPSRAKTIVDKSKATYLTKKGENRKPRTYSQAIPSQHCHICSRRPTEASPHAVCGNLLRGRCRKTICTKCFQTFRWDLKAARDGPPGSWECPHCRGECPQRAQCVIYNRTSDRRRLKLINHRKRKASAVVGGSGSGGGGSDKDRGKRTGMGLKKTKAENNNNKVNVNEVNNNTGSSESGRRGIATNALRTSTTTMINSGNSLSCGENQNLTIIGKEAFLDGIIRSEEIGAWNNPDQIANFGQLERALTMDLIHQPNSG